MSTLTIESSNEPPKTFAPAKPGEAVRYMTAEGVEIPATVVDVYGAADVVSLVYRREGEGLATADQVAWAPGLALHWYRPGEEPPQSSKVPRPGGKEVVLGAVVHLHAAFNPSARPDETHFRIEPATVIAILGPDADRWRFRVQIGTPTSGMEEKILEVGHYRGDGFRKNRWSWPSDNVEAPGPVKDRDRDPAHKPARCPISGEYLPRNQMIPVGVGAGVSPSWRSAEGLLSPEGAETLRRFLAGEVDTLKAAPLPKPAPAKPAKQTA